MNDLRNAINDFLNYYVHGGDRDQAMKDLQKLVTDAYTCGQKSALGRVSDFLKHDYEELTI